MNRLFKSLVALVLLSGLLWAPSAEAKAPVCSGTLKLVNSSQKVVWVHSVRIRYKNQWKVLWSSGSSHISVAAGNTSSFSFSKRGARCNDKKARFRLYWGASNSKKNFGTRVQVGSTLTFTRTSSNWTIKGS